jgi:exonuclease III
MRKRPNDRAVPVYVLALPFHRHRLEWSGVMIGSHYAGAAVADRVRSAYVDREARKGKGPSDHAPIVVDLG